MKIPNKRKLKQIVSQNAADIDFQDIINLKKCTSKRYPFLVNDNNLASDNPSPFRKNFFETI